MRPCPAPTPPAELKLPPTRSEIWLPDVNLASCVRAVLLRDTRGVALSDAQRLNHVGVSPYFGLSWYFEGAVELLQTQDHTPAAPTTPRTALAGPVLLSGPWERPIVSYNPGPVHHLLLIFMPDALHQLTGLDSSAWVGRHAEARSALPPDWAPWLESVQQSATPQEAMQRIETFLTPLWAQARPKGLGLARIGGDWVQALSARLALSGAGKSLRQLERRVRLAAGQPLRHLQSYARSEHSWRVNREAYMNEQLRWADAAAAGGYADQSHLVRSSLRMTGFTPAELLRRIESEESFWVYRLWQ
jgi:AraC-like DNA-binding protein